MFKNINATVLFVQDFEACVKFYRDVLEFRVKDSDEGFASFDVTGQELAIMDLKTAAQMISDEVIQPEKAGSHRIMLAAFVDDTDEVYASLRDKGVTFVKAPTTQPWGQRTAYFQDPERNIWEISHFISEE